MRVLVVEDEWKVADAIRDGLQAENYDVIVERSGEGGFYRAATTAFDLILLDLGLPGCDGLEILAAIRQKRIAVPVIILTARDGIGARLAGFNAGADDYLVKPFALAELLVRMKALLRRSVLSEGHALIVGTLMLEPLSRRVTRGRDVIALTGREYDLLEYLMRYEGQVVSRETLVRDVWGELTRSTPLDNVIDVHMARLRRKVDIEGATRLIHTVRGVGFTMRAAEPRAV